MTKPSPLHTYILLVVSLSFLPLIVQLFHLLPPLPHVFTTITTPTYQNLDNLKDDYHITGTIPGYQTFPARQFIYLHLYKKHFVQFANFRFSRYVHFAQIPITPNGDFSYPAPSGEYQLIPTTLPQHHIFFSSTYPLSLAHHHPTPLTISLPHTSIWEFISTKISLLGSK